MKRCIWLVVVVACSKSADTPASGSATATSGGTGSAGGGGGGASSLANKVAKLTDACPLLPAATAARLVPDGGKPQSEQYPTRCSVFGKISAIAISFDTGDAPTSHDTDVGESSMLEHLSPGSASKGDVYLTLSLGRDGNGTNRNLHVEVNGHDGVEHKDDAIGLAREVLANIAKLPDGK